MILNALPTPLSVSASVSTSVSSSASTSASAPVAVTVTVAAAASVSDSAHISVARISASISPDIVTCDFPTALPPPVPVTTPIPPSSIPTFIRITTC